MEPSGYQSTQRRNEFAWYPAEIWNVRESNLMKMFMSFAQLVSIKLIKAGKDFVFVGCPEPIYGRDVPAAGTNICIVRAEEKLIWFPLYLEWTINQKEFLKRTGGWLYCGYEWHLGLFCEKAVLLPTGKPLFDFMGFKWPSIFSLLGVFDFTVRSESDMSHVYEDVSPGLKQPGIYTPSLRPCGISGAVHWDLGLINLVWKAGAFL